MENILSIDFYQQSQREMMCYYYTTFKEHNTTSTWGLCSREEKRLTGNRSGEYSGWLKSLLSQRKTPVAISTWIY